MPQIGIVVPVYNGERYLAQTLESVLAQTFTDWEMVIVDDGSTDGSSVLARSFTARDPRIHVLPKPNGGVAMARNTGSHALGNRCEFIAFLDQDDVWYPHALARLHALLTEDAHASAAHGTYERIDDVGRQKRQSEREAAHWARWGFEGDRLVRWPSDKPTTFEVLAFMDPIITPGQVLVRWSALLAVGEFDSSVAPADDWDLWLRLAQRSYLAYTDMAVLRYRLHDGNASLRPHLVEEATKVVRRKHARSAALDRVQRMLLVRGEVWVYWFVSVLRLIWAREHWARGQYWAAIKDLRHALVQRYYFEVGRMLIWCRGTQLR